MTKKKAWTISGIAVGGGILVCIVLFCILWFAVFKIDLSIAVAQVGEEQKVNVTWDVSKNVSKVVIDVTHDGDLVSSTVVVDKGELAIGEAEVFAYYGKQKIKVTVYDDGFYYTSETKKCNVFASEYNIAPITATMPVTLFSLSLDDITRSATDSPVPTFVWFKRSGAWDWSNLPENVYAMPTVGVKDFYNGSQKDVYNIVSDWVKELYEINSDSHFNFFYNDYYAYGWLDATVANGLAREKYNVTLLSDGTASFNYFNKHFNNADDAVVAAEYAKMKAKYEKVKTQIADKGNYKAGSSKYAIDTDTIREYAWLMVKEEANVSWWLTRISGTMATANATMYSELSSNTNVKVKDLKTLLTALDTTQQNNLKSLYNFSDEAFEKAETENKNVMVILGTWDQNEYHFADYVNAVKAYYGDDYVYYYKGHPKNPPQTVPGKMLRLENLGLIDVDATIPAELIMFFKPDIFISGYASTTFVSAEDDKACALFDVTKAAAAASSSISSYDEKMDLFMSTIDHSNSTYASVVPESTNTFYLIEAADANTIFEFAIFNATTNVIKYYKTVGGIFTEVQR